MFTYGNDYHFANHNDTELSNADKLRLFRLVAEELAEEERPVVWIFDSFDTLVDRGLSNTDKLNKPHKHPANIMRLYELSKFLIPLPAKMKFIKSVNKQSIRGYYITVVVLFTFQIHCSIYS